MHNQHLVEMLQEGYTTVRVHFLTGSQKHYVYKIPNDMAEGLEEGQHCVVSVVDEFKIVRVLEVHDEPQIDVHSSIQYKWIVQVIDTARWQEQIAKEEEFRKRMFDIERTAQRKELAAKITEHMDEKSSGLFTDAVKFLNADKSDSEFTESDK